MEKARTIDMGYRSQTKPPHCRAEGPEDWHSSQRWGLQGQEGGPGTKDHGRDSRDPDHCGKASNCHTGPHIPTAPRKYSPHWEGRWRGQVGRRNRCMKVPEAKGTGVSVEIRGLGRRAGRVCQRQTPKAKAGVLLCFSCCDKTPAKTNLGRKGLFGFHVPITVHGGWVQGRSQGRNHSEGRGGTQLTGLFISCFYRTQDHLPRLARPTVGLTLP